MSVVRAVVEAVHSKEGYQSDLEGLLEDLWDEKQEGYECKVAKGFNESVDLEDPINTAL